MKKRATLLFFMVTVFSVGCILYGWVFLHHQIGGAVLTEETVAGSRNQADGLMVSFRADSADSLHWISSFDYSADQTISSFRRGELDKTADTSVYDDIRFTGWNEVPYTTQLHYDGLGELQEQPIQTFYQAAQERVMETGLAETGKIKVKDYLDFYPVSFRFQFGNKIYNSDNALTGLKRYAMQDQLSAENSAAYDDDVNLYVALNGLLRIPVIENEYQEYRISKVESSADAVTPGCQTEIERSLDNGEDYYVFDPILALQEENTMDGKQWFHPDLTGNLPYEAGEVNDDAGASDESHAIKTASAYNLKNRILFIVNQRTAKGVPVDVSHLADGYGIYELPIETSASSAIRKGNRSWLIPDPKPLTDQLAMVYPLDEEAEYVELSLSKDHRYLAVFSVKGGTYFVDLVDADTWTSRGPMEIFPASDRMTYAWGEDGSLAVTNHKGYISVLSRPEADNRPYEILFRGKIPSSLDQEFFDSEMVVKEHSYVKYKYGIDRGLAVAVKDGKAALVQNLLTGDAESNVRNAALACAVIDKSGVTYSGRLKSNIVDWEYDMDGDEIQTTKDLLAYTAIQNSMIAPVRNKNWCTWDL
ncbi:MAG: hypothetical protein ACI4WY_01055 [Anaerovoracaceae bacterium]